MIPNRTAFLALEADDLTPDELHEITGFARCADCGHLMRAKTLVSLPEHRCSQRQAVRRDRER